MKNEEMIGVMLQDEGDDGQAKQRREAEGGNLEKQDWVVKRCEVAMIDNDDE